MEEDVRFTICRLCLDGNNDLINVFDSNGIIEYKPADVITELLRHDVSADDKYPQCVCIECMSKLKEFKRFKEKCDSCRELLDTAHSAKDMSPVATIHDEVEPDLNDSWDMVVKETPDERDRESGRDETGIRAVALTKADNPTIRPEKSVVAGKPKRKVIVATIQVKKELIAKHEGGMRVVDLAAMFKMPKSTVCTILKRKEAIQAANVATGVTTLTSKRSHAIEEMEKLLLMWINEKQLAGDVISERIICEKAKHLHSELKRYSPGTSGENEEFKGSRGWFAKFKKRTGINSIVMHGDIGGNCLEEGEKLVKRRRLYQDVGL